MLEMQVANCVEWNSIGTFSWFAYFFMPCLILRMPLRNTILLCGGDGIELDWLDLVAIETVDDEDAVVFNIKQFFVFAVAPAIRTKTISIHDSFVRCGVFDKSSNTYVWLPHFFLRNPCVANQFVALAALNDL